MRRICWGTALLTVFIVALPADAAGPGCACNQGATWGETGAYQGLSSPACAASCYGMSPGCCESAPSCCDNAWDGYCQEVSRWRDLWRRVGTGARLGCCYGQVADMPCPIVEDLQPVVHPVSGVPEPATPIQTPIPPVPEPAMQGTSLPLRLR